MSRPHWQQSECPSWCTVEHSESDHPEDRAHRDDGITVAALFRHRMRAGGHLIDEVVAGELTVGRWQRDGDGRSWRSVGNDAGMEYEIDEQSFQRFIAVLLSERARHDAGCRCEQRRAESPQRPAQLWQPGHQ